MSVIVVGHSLNCTLMSFFIHNHNSGGVQQWKACKGKKWLGHLVLRFNELQVYPLNKLVMRMEVL